MPPKIKSPLKYICVYYARFQEMIQDYKVMKILWIFSIPTSVILIFLEFFFIHDIKSMTTFKGLHHQWSANQEARYFVNVVFLLTVLTYVFLQIRLLDEIRLFCGDWGWVVVTLPTAEILSGKNARAWVSMVLYLKKINEN